jgi:hypothetical protein
MAEEKKVAFSADSSMEKLSAQMQKMRLDARKDFNEQALNAKKLTDNAKEQLKILREYTVETQKKNKLEQDHLNKMARELRNKGGYANMADAVSLESRASRIRQEFEAKNQAFKELMNSEFRNQSPAGKGSPSSSVFSQIIKAGLLRDFTGAAGQIPNARNGTEIIPTLTGVGGAATGAVAGELFGASSAGAQIGKAIGEYAGQAMVRHLTERSRFQGAQGRLRGLGGSTAIEDLSGLGMDLVQSASLREQMLRSSGQNMNVSEVAKLMKAYALDASVMAGYAGTSRLTGKDADPRFLLGMAKGNGVSRVNYDRVLQNQTGLINLVGQGSVEPNDFTIMKAMMDFNRIGGPFSVNDPRSMGLMSTIHENIANPNSPFGQAMNYSLLRKLNPDMGVTGLLEQQQKGIGNRELTGGILDEINRMGGNDEFKIMMTAQRFGLQGNIGAARKLFKGYNQGDVFGELSEEEMSGLASENVAPLEKNQAKITNAFINGMGEGISTVSEMFKTEMAAAAKESAAEFARAFHLASGDYKGDNASIWEKMSDAFGAFGASAYNARKAKANGK